MAATEKKDIIVIKTLGGFNVIKNDISLTKSFSSSKKIWELFKFMLTHSDKSYTPESLLSQLWIAEDYSDPKSTLRRQMYRLRKILDEGQNDEEQSILYTNGYYCWNKSKEINLDCVKFEEYISQGDSLKKDAPNEALTLYMKAIDLYEGDYLPACMDQHWVFPHRNQLRHIFLKTISNTIDLLKEKDAYEEILDVCQKAIAIDIYEESFHIQLMEAMLILGNHRFAIDHYIKINGFYDREMGLKPSIEMRNTYKKLLKAQQTITDDMDLFETLEENKVLENAFFCEPDVFKSIYELERRRSERANIEFGIAVLTMPFTKESSYSQNEMRMNRLKQHLLVHLRKGDTVTRWASQQFVLLLPDVSEKNITLILQRILTLEDEYSNVVINQTKYLH